MLQFCQSPVRVICNAGFSSEYHYIFLCRAFAFEKALFFHHRAGISFFPMQRVSLPTFMNGGELKFLGGMKKQFPYFKIFHFGVSISANIIKYVCYENNYLPE